MTTYTELQEQAQELLKRAEQLRKEEIKSVIEDIRKKMAEYGITAEDIGLTNKKAKTKPALAPRFKSKDGTQTWSGRGRTPQWMKDALEAGASKEEFLIPEASGAPDVAE